MTPMMATTIRSSMSVKPRLLRMVMLPYLSSTMPLRHPIVKAPAPLARHGPGDFGEAGELRRARLQVLQERPASRFGRMLCRIP